MDNDNQPATKQDLVELENRLREYIHDTETKLLRAFYAYAESNQKRFIDLERSDFSIRDRLTTLEGRVTEVEKRLNMPPQA